MTTAFRILVGVKFGMQGVREAIGGQSFCFAKGAARTDIYAQSNAAVLEQLMEQSSGSRWCRAVGWLVAGRIKVTHGNRTLEIAPVDINDRKKLDPRLRTSNLR